MPDVSETKTIVLPANGNWVEFEISGEHASEAMNDAVIEAHANTADGILCGNARLTVVWVDDFNIRGEGYFSDDNDMTVVLVPDRLGCGVVTGTHFGDSVVKTAAHVVEISGQVHPSAMTNPIRFIRDYIDVYNSYLYPTSSVLDVYCTTSIPRQEGGNDPIPDGWTDENPWPNGSVYNVDIPGHRLDSLQTFPIDTKCYIRINFLQFATFDGIRCSDDFAWFVRISGKRIGTQSSPDFQFETRSNFPSDNIAGTGTTTMRTDE